MAKRKQNPFFSKKKIREKMKMRKHEPARKAKQNSSENNNTKKMLNAAKQQWISIYLFMSSLRECSSFLFLFCLFVFALGVRGQTRGCLSLVVACLKMRKNATSGQLRDTHTQRPPMVWKRNLGENDNEFWLDLRLINGAIMGPI